MHTKTARDRHTPSLIVQVVRPHATHLHFWSGTCLMVTVTPYSLLYIREKMGRINIFVWTTFDFPGLVLMLLLLPRKPWWCVYDVSVARTEAYLVLKSYMGYSMAEYRTEWPNKLWVKRFVLYQILKHYFHSVSQICGNARLSPYVSSLRLITGFDWFWYGKYIMKIVKQVTVPLSATSYIDLHANLNLITFVKIEIFSKIWQHCVKHEFDKYLHILFETLNITYL